MEKLTLPHHREVSSLLVSEAGGAAQFRDEQKHLFLVATNVLGLRLGDQQRLLWVLDLQVVSLVVIFNDALVAGLRLKRAAWRCIEVNVIDSIGFVVVAGEDHRSNHGPFKGFLVLATRHHASFENLVDRVLSHDLK